MIDIPKNDYVENTSVNEATVQEICTAFLRGCVWHPRSDGAYRNSNNRLMARSKNAPFTDFGDHYDESHHSEYRFKHFNECEMRRAWKELIAAGYHIFVFYQFGSWLGYRCDKKPYYNGGAEVRDFLERWT